jgi:ADP-ribose pyrophosphatase YjhB (NUDIX family)
MGTIRKPRLKARVAIAQDDCILCVLHAKPDQEPFWCLPGGNVDDGEGLADAAARELREEVGVDVATDGAILIMDGPDVGAVEVILRGAIVAGTAAISADSGDACPRRFAPQRSVPCCRSRAASPSCRRSASPTGRASCCADEPARHRLRLRVGTVLGCGCAKGSDPTDDQLRRTRP